MKLSRFTSAIFAASLCATVGVAQSNEEMKKDLEALKAQVAAQKAELSALKADKGAVARDESVENEINRMSERLAAATTVNSAANKITFSGEFRFRSYAELGQTSGNVDRDGWWNDSRVRLGTMYEFSRDVAAFAEFQSHFAFGNNSSTNDDVSPTNVELYQAWVKTSNLFGRSEFSAKFGRQELVFGNQFQFGNADWYNGQTFDGTRYDWNSDSFSLTGLWFRTATLSNGDANQFPGYGPFAVNGDGHDHDEIYGAYFTLKTIKNHTLDLYWLYVNEHDGLTLGSGSTLGGFNNPGLTGFNKAYFHVLGGRIGGNVDVASGLDWNLEFAYETGAVNGVADGVDNFAVEGEVGIMFNKDNRVRAWIRGLFAEGPDSNNTGYIPLFPNRHSNTASFHARYGAMDVFPMSDIFALTGGVHFDPAKDWTVGLTGVWGQSDTDHTGGIGDSYGFEVDVWAEYRYSETMTFSAGVAFLFPDDQLDNTTSDLFTPFDGDTQFLFWLQARLFF